MDDLTLHHALQGSDTDVADLNVEQKNAFFEAMAGKHLFITGGAGTGKSYVLRKIIKYAPKRVLVTAPTGLAASLHEHGLTLHSVVCEKTQLSASNEQPLMLVIDEVSMVNAKLFVDLQKVVHKENTPVSKDTVQSPKRFKREEWPSCVQLVCVGDLFQLPPVRNCDKVHLTEFVCTSQLWLDLCLKENTKHLSQALRQEEDEEFISILNRLRIGICTTADLEILNSNDDSFSEENAVHIYCTNKKVDEENQKQFIAISKICPSTTYEWQASHDKGNLTKLFKQVLGISSGKHYSSHLAQSARKGIFQKTLKLTLGCVVMVTVNVDVEKGIVNGLRGTVQKIDNDSITIQPFNESNEVTIDRVTRRWGDDSVAQFPIRLAWAITVHKSQGLTLDKGVIDVSDAFEFGQVYTALSRFRRLADVKLKNGMNPLKVWAHPAALNYFGEDNKVQHTYYPITAVADIIGEPCTLVGTLNRENARFLRLDCSTVPAALLSSITIFNDTQGYQQPQLSTVTVFKFLRSKVKRPCKFHKFYISRYDIKQRDEKTKPNAQVNPTVLHQNDPALNKHSRVSVAGKVVEQTCPNTYKVQRVGKTVDKTDTFIIRVVSTSSSGPMITLGRGLIYTISDVRSCGGGSPLVLDSLSTVFRNKSYRDNQKDRRILIRPELSMLRDKACVYIEVLCSAGDVISAFISPLNIIRDEDSTSKASKELLSAALDVERIVVGFFDSVFTAVANEDLCPAGDELVAPEIPHLRLGHSGTKILKTKYGVSTDLAKRSASKLYDALKKCKDIRTADYSSQQKFVLIEIFCAGFGNDMMNDFFAFHLFDWIVNFTHNVVENHRDLVEAANLTPKYMSKETLIKSFEPHIRSRDFENWVNFYKLSGKTDEFWIPHLNDKPILLVDHKLISQRSRACADRMSKLREEANDLFAGRLEQAESVQKFASFFDKVDEKSKVDSTQISIVVGTDDIAMRVAQATEKSENGLYFSKLMTSDNTATSTLCVIGGIQQFKFHRYALRSLVLAFVEPVEMLSTASPGCRVVAEVVDVRLPQGSEIIPVHMYAKDGNEPDGIALLSDMFAESKYPPQSIGLKKIPCPNTDRKSAVDCGTDQLGNLLRANAKDSTWLVWAVNRKSNDKSHIATVIFDELAKLPLRGSAVDVEKLLKGCVIPAQATSTTPGIRIGTFNICVLGGANTKKDHEFIFDLIKQHELAVVALQEVKRPFSDFNSDAFAFKSHAQADDATSVFQAKNRTGVNGSFEYPSILINERLVEPAGDRTSSTWHGYVDDVLECDPKNPKHVYPRVPYYWKLKVKGNGTPFIVVSLHFAPDSHYTAKKNRKGCMDHLMNFVKEKWPNEDVFIVGDFNESKKFAETLKQTSFKTLLGAGQYTNVKGNEPYDHILVPNIKRFTDATPAVVISLLEEVEKKLGAMKGGKRKNDLTALMDGYKQKPRNKTLVAKFHSSLSDHNPVYFDYVQWKENKCILPS